MSHIRECIIDRGFCSALLPILPCGHSWYHSKNFPCLPKRVFLIDHHCKRDHSPVRVLTGHLELQARSIMILCMIFFLIHGDCVCAQLHISSGRKLTRKPENFFCESTRQAILVELNLHLLWVHYLVLFKIYGHKSGFIAFINLQQFILS